MKIVHGILILLVLGLLVPGSAALDQDQIKITSSHDWITAGPGTGTDETATITVVIDNESFINESVKVDEVLFSCANEFLYNGAGSKIGDLSSSKVSETQYEATFHSKKSGDATIQVNVKYTVDKVEGGPFERSNDTVQRVDHAMPYAFEYLDYDTEITVNTDTDITLQMIDKYGNVVDSRKEDSLVPVKNAEGVRFQCSSETDAGFWKDESTLTNDITKFVDSKGNLSVKFKASSSAGANPVNLICVTAVPKMLITIYGEGESTPASMTTSVDPSSRCVPGDGESTFTIVYQLFDQFGNPSPNSPLYIHTSIDGEERNVFTNEDGYAILTYGPKTSIGLVTFYADSRLTPTVRDDVELRFTSSDGTWFEAYSNPSDLSSYEVKPFTNGTIYARVTDNVGRGVWNEKISFRINASSIENQTAAPMMDPKIYNPASDSWEDSSVDILTDEYGYAEVPFRSGEFPDQDAENFDPSSSGSCKVTVTWDRSDEPDQIKEVKVTWRNYPYIRAETEVSSSSIRPGDTFDVTIRLIGDGFAIRQHLPVDVVLLLDRSEDMLISEKSRGEDRDRMEWAREAAMRLLKGGTGEGLDRDSDRVAFIPYGDVTNDTTFFPDNTANILREGSGKDLVGTLPGECNWAKNIGKDGSPGDDEDYLKKDNYPGFAKTVYSNYAPIILDYSTGTEHWLNHEDALWDTVPLKSSKTGQASAPLRLGLYEAINYMSKNERSDAEVKAIVLLMQNYWMYWGHPLAKSGDGSEDPLGFDNKNSATWTRFPDLSDEHQNMANYAKANDIKIYLIYYPTGNPSSIESDLRVLTDVTGGQFFYAANEEELCAAFDAVREALMKEAGVNTEMGIKLINNVESLNWTAEQILTYVPNDPDSTAIDYYNWTIDPYTPYQHHEDYPRWEDRTSDWLDDNNFHYNVGNISIKETWETTFTMRVNASISETLNFSLFDDDSYITFTNQDGNTTIPLPSQQISVSPNLTATAGTVANLELWNLTVIAWTPEYMEFGWELNYTGEGDFLVERVEYRPEDGGYSLGGWGEKTVPASRTSDTVKIMTETLPRMEYYLRVTVNSDDAGVKKAILQFSLSEPERAYIRIE